MINKLRKIKKTIEFKISEAKSIKVKYGLIVGKRMHGNLYMNHRLDTLSDEENFYKILNLKDKVIVELGANLGVYTLYFSEAAGKNGRVFSFEPNPIVFNLLKKNMMKNKCDNVELLNYGVGDEDSKLVFVSKRFVNETGSFDKAIQEKLKKDKFGYRSWEIEIKKLDSVKEFDSVKKIDFIKIDIEGMEMEALLGAKKLIKTGSPDLYIEIHGVDNITKIERLKNIFELLKELNADYKGIHLPDCIDVNDIIADRKNIEYNYRTKVYTYDNYAFFFSPGGDFDSIRKTFSEKKYWRIR